MADITLAAADDFNLDFDDPGYGFDLGPSDGIGSADYDDFDLGLDFGDGNAQAADLESVEMGRDAASVAARASIGSHLLGKDGDFDAISNRALSEDAFGAEMNMDVDMDFGPDVGGMDIDLGLDFGGQTPGLARSPSRACEPLLFLPPPGDNTNNNF